MAFQGVRAASLAAFAAFLSLGSPALAGGGDGRAGPDLPERRPPMEIVPGAARPIRAWVEFCRKDPGSCAIDASEPERIVLDPATWTLIQDVNDEVNDEIIPQTDKEHWGVVDVWGYPDDGIGDCEDFQLLKRRLLERAGLPRRAMRMTVVIDDEGEGHAVLTVLTDRGDLILDNKGAHGPAPVPVLHADMTGYAFVRREGAEPGPDGGPWVNLERPSAPVAAVAASGPR